MEILDVRSLWPEKIDFDLERKDTGDMYIFVHTLTPTRFWQNGGLIFVPPGAVIMYDKYSYQRFTAYQMPLIHDWMHISGDLDEVMRACNLNYNTIYPIKCSGMITELMQDIELECMQAEAYAAEIAELKVKEILLRAARDIAGESNKSFAIQNVDMFLNARAEIHLEYNREWTVAQMAELVHLSPSRFHDIYKRVFGISPKQDLQNVRIEHAKNLLLEGKYSVREIASMIGYENEYYFIRKFKSTTGKTPKHYKNA